MSRILVAGGGIAGLAAAIAAALRGHDAMVLERRAQFEELSAGIQLAPNAFHALDRLGVADRVRARAVPIEELRLMSGVSGDCLVRLPLGEPLERRFGAPYMVVHRGDLHGALLDVCAANPHVTLRANAQVADLQHDARGVAVTLATGERVRGDALLGADGLRSLVRRHVVGDGEPRACGHTTYRAVMAFDAVPEVARCNAAVLWAAPGAHVVHYPIVGGSRVNLVATRVDGGWPGPEGKGVPAGDILERFANLCSPVLELLTAAPRWRAWPLFDRPPALRTSTGRVLLVGDAAHPMLQYAAQGAGMALEDAACLADALREPLPDALAEVDQTRRDRTARVQRAARDVAFHLYHPHGERARRRDKRLSSLSGEALYDEVAWLYGHASSATT